MMLRKTMESIFANSFVSFIIIVCLLSFVSYTLAYGIGKFVANFFG